MKYGEEVGKIKYKKKNYKGKGVKEYDKWRKNSEKKTMRSRRIRRRRSLRKVNEKLKYR